MGPLTISMDSGQPPLIRTAYWNGVIPLTQVALVRYNTAFTDYMLWLYIILYFFCNLQSIVALESTVAGYTLHYTLLHLTIIITYYHSFSFSYYFILLSLLFLIVIYTATYFYFYLSLCSCSCIVATMWLLIAKNCTLVYLKNEM